jgi:hypothetical protein
VDTAHTEPISTWHVLAAAWDGTARTSPIKQPKAGCALLDDTRNIHRRHMHTRAQALLVTQTSSTVFLSHDTPHVWGASKAPPFGGGRAHTSHVWDNKTRARHMRGQEMLL